MEGEKCLKCSVLPQRIVLAIMGFFACFVSASIDMCISVAITEMVVPLNQTGNSTPSNDGFHRQIDAPRYNWTQQQQGWLLSSNFIGRVVTTIIGGLLAQKYGGKWVLSIGILLLAVGSIATAPVLAYGGFIAFIVLRTAMSCGTGVLFPSLTVQLAAWIPKTERTKLVSFVYSGFAVGLFISSYFTGLMLSYWPWPVVFYVWGSVALIWFIAFTILCSSDPASHSCITEAELDYLQKEMGQLKRQDDLPPTPWKDILTSMPVLAYIIGQMGHDWFYVVLSYNLPKYLREVMAFSVYEIGFYSSLNTATNVGVSIVCGFLSNYLIRRDCLTITQARKITNAISCVFPAFFVMVASFAGSNKMLVVISFLLAKGLMGAYFAGVKLNPLDLSPNYAGSLNSLAFTFGALTAAVTPTFIGIMAPNSTMEEWRFVFWITLGIAMLKTIIYSVWASGETQPWNNPIASKDSENVALNEQKQKFIE